MEGGDGEAKIEVNADDNVEAKMDMDESMADGHLETFPTLVIETLAVASENQRETKDTEGGGEKKKLSLMNTRKMPTRRTTTNDKDQANLKGVTKDDISTKKKGFNVKIVNSNMRLYDDNNRRIWWIGRRQWFGWKEWTCSKWRDKVE